MICAKHISVAAIVAVTFQLAATACCGGEELDGFVRLFDGKSLDGWHLMNNANFVAEDGVIKHDTGQGWLRSEKEYSEFVLRLQLRFMEPKPSAARS